MSWFYRLGKIGCRLVETCCVRSTILHADRSLPGGGYVLACSHLSHLEPFVVSLAMRRQIDWMARIEFYKYHLIASALDAVDAFPVDRAGVPVRAIRTAIDRCRRGKIVGIFPEGGVTHGADAAIRGGAIKRGACVIARRANVPIVPVVVVGTDQWNHVGPWLPFKNARVYMIFGQPIFPIFSLPPRAARFAMAEQLREQFQNLYIELCRTCGIDDNNVA